MRLIRNLIRNYKNPLCLIIILFFFGSFDESLSDHFAEKSFAVQRIIDCHNSPLLKKCKNIISYTESLQLQEYRKGNLRCQTSLLGVQTELIKKKYFSKNEDNSIKINIPFVIKNCKL